MDGMLVTAGGAGDGSEMGIDADEVACSVEAFIPYGSAQVEDDEDDEDGERAPGTRQGLGFWRDLPPMLEPRVAMGFCVWRGSFVLVGGMNPGRESLDSATSFNGEVPIPIP